MKRDDLKQRKLDYLISNTDIYLSEQGFKENGTNIINELIKCRAIQITSPEEQLLLNNITFDSISNPKNTCSIKPGNILLNIKCLIKSLPEIVALGVSIVYDIPILKVYSFLSIWKTVFTAAKIKIDKSLGIVIIALWLNCDSNHNITVKKGFESVNAFCRGIGEAEFNYESYKSNLQKLEEIKTIGIYRNNDIRLKECVKIKYNY